MKQLMPINQYKRDFSALPPPPDVFYHMTSAVSSEDSLLVTSQIVFPPRFFLDSCHAYMVEGSGQGF